MTGESLVLGVSLDKVEELELFELVNQEISGSYDPLNISSIVSFLIKFGLLHRHNEPSLEQSIAIDLATAIHAFTFLLFSDVRYIKNLEWLAV